MAFGFVGHVYERQVYGFVRVLGNQHGALQAVCLAYAPAHQHTVNGVVQTLLGDGYEELYGWVAVGACAGCPYGAQWIGQCRTSTFSRVVEKVVDGRL